MEIDSDGVRSSRTGSPAADPDDTDEPSRDSSLSQSEIRDEQSEIRDEQSDSMTPSAETDPSTPAASGSESLSNTSQAEDPRRTNRWRGITAVVLAPIAVGIAMVQPGLLLVAVIGIAYVVYPRIFGITNPALRLERSVSTNTPRPGDRVEVTVTVTNDGATWLSDLRIVDGVPDPLTVIDGSPRLATALRPGGSVSYSYTVRADQGTYGFEPATSTVRNVTGTLELEQSLSSETELVCASVGSKTHLRRDNLSDAGTVISNRGGSGTEFFRTREYRQGDSMRRIDWNRFARTGELSTVDYREERAATVVLLVDARRAAYRARPSEPHAVSLSTGAVGQLLHSLVRDRNRIGLAGFGRARCWRPPGTGRDHVAELRATLGSHPAFASTPPNSDHSPAEHLDWLRRRLPDQAQVVVFSPLCDDSMLHIARKLDASGHPVTVVSPDVTDGDSVGGRLARLERANRTSELRSASISTIDWDPAKPLESALLNASESH